MLRTPDVNNQSDQVWRQPERNHSSLWSQTSRNDIEPGSIDEETLDENLTSRLVRQPYAEEAGLYPGEHRKLQVLQARLIETSL